MTDYTNVPIAAAGDWIDDAYLNTYLGDNFRAVFGALTAAGQLLVSLAANRLTKVSVTGNAGYLLTEDPALPEKMKFAAPPVSLPAGGSAYQGLRVASGGSAKEWGALLNLLGRQGGSDTIWNNPGTGNRGLANALVQVGAVSISMSGGPPAAAGPVSVTFPIAFTYAPLIYLSIQTGAAGFSTGVWTQLEYNNVSATGFDIYLAQNANSSSYNPRTVNWIAIGPK